MSMHHLQRRAALLGTRQSDLLLLRRACLLGLVTTALPPTLRLPGPASPALLPSHPAPPPAVINEQAFLMGHTVENRAVKMGWVT